MRDDPVEGGALEAELGETVGADVHLEPGLLPGFSRSAILSLSAVTDDVERPRRMPASTFGCCLAAFAGGGLAPGAPYADDVNENMTGNKHAERRHEDDRCVGRRRRVSYS